MQGFGPQGIEFDTPALTLINYRFYRAGMGNFGPLVQTLISFFRCV